jgi:hypothetical protein
VKPVNSAETAQEHADKAIAVRKVQTAVRAAGLMTGAHVQVGSRSGWSPCDAGLSTSGNTVPGHCSAPLPCCLPQQCVC